VRFEGLIFDFDGVLIESEYAGNKQLAEALTALGHPTTVDDALTHFVGLGGQDFLDAVAKWIGGAIPQAFHEARAIEDARALAEGVGEVIGAVAFVRSLPPSLPKAIASSSTTRWIEAHLAHIGLQGAFGDHIYSGREHVKRGKPAPDIYLHAAEQIGVPIEQVAIIEDSPVGATGAVASGAYVVGLAAGSHCRDGHGEEMLARGVHAVAHDFQEVARLLSL
jgi:beta-phosphoglucomutase-like phosphatase (HAD superfamily)